MRRNGGAVCHLEEKQNSKIGEATHFFKPPQRTSSNDRQEMGFVGVTLSSRKLPWPQQDPASSCIFIRGNLSSPCKTTMWLCFLHAAGKRSSGGELVPCFITWFKNDDRSLPTNSHIDRIFSIGLWQLMSIHLSGRMLEPSLCKCEFQGFG